MQPILQIAGISKTLGDFALTDVTFELPRGTIMGLVGPNGAGKTTTIKILMGVVQQDLGSVKIFGLDTRTDAPAIRDRVGFVWDENVFYEDLSPARIGRMLARFYSRWNEDSYRGFLREFAIPPDQRIRQLSRGTRSKLALAAALSHDAELIVLDEPTSGLDPIFRARLIDVLTRVIADGRRSVLFSTHVTSDLEKVADYVTFINQGRIVFSKVKDDLLSSYVLVKGSADRLAEVRPHLVGLREHAFGFEGLSAAREPLRRLTGPSLAMERVSIDDILVYSTIYAQRRLETPS
jgi:ABC-2 type transport system ATP-binding protein